jgi:hypothetical protein
MVYFLAKIPNFGKFWRALACKNVDYFIDIKNLVWTFGIFYDHLVHFVFIWLIFPILVACIKQIWQPWLIRTAGGQLLMTVPIT